MKVMCDVEETDLENDNGYVIAGVTATCRRCNNETESFGTSERSVRRCLILMREECPYGESNFYVASAGEDENGV